MDVLKANKIRAITAQALRNIATLSATGVLMQTFLEMLGFSSQLNYIHTSLIQAANVSAIMLSSGWADKGNIIKRTAFIQLPFGLLFLLYIPLCITKNVSIGGYVFLLSIGIVQSVASGLFTVCDYKLPYFIFNPDDYGTITAVSGIVSSVISFGISYLISYLSNYYDYCYIMIFAFLISTVCILISVVLFRCQKSLIDMDASQNMSGTKKKNSLTELFRYPIFFKLIPANLSRGIATGTTLVFAIIAFDLGFDEKTTSLMVSLQSISILAGCAIFGILAKYMSSKIPVFAGSLTFLLIPLMLIPNKALFLTVYTIIILGRTFVDYGIPAILIKSVPLEIAGPYNAWRMILHTAGTLIGTSVAAVIPPEFLFILTIVFQIFSGLCYFLSKELK